MKCKCVCYSMRKLKLDKIVLNIVGKLCQHSSCPKNAFVKELGYQMQKGFEAIILEKNIKKVKYRSRSCLFLT